MDNILLLILLKLDCLWIRLLVGNFDMRKVYWFISKFESYLLILLKFIGRNCDSISIVLYI